MAMESPALSRPPLLLALSLSLAVACGRDEPAAPVPAGDTGPGTTLHLLARQPETRIEQPAAILPEGDVSDTASWGIHDGGGWARKVHRFSAQPFLQSSASQASLILPATHAEARTLVLALWCARPAAGEHPDARPGRVHLSLNGVALSEEGLALRSEPALVEVHTPEPAWRRGENVLELRVDVQEIEGRRAWDTLALASVSYGAPETILLSTADETARLEPRTGLVYALEMRNDAVLELAGRADAPGELRVRTGLLDPRSGEELNDAAAATPFALSGKELKGRLSIAHRTGAVRLLELEWSTPSGAALELTRLDVHEEKSPPRPPIVFVSIDTFAARHLSVYGYGRRTSPVLEEFRRDAVLFERCLANAPWTLPSYLSVMSGLYPRAHDITPESQAGAEADIFASLFLAPNRWTLAEALRARGYRTGGFVDTYWLSPLYGVRQGFDEYDGHAALVDPADPHGGIEKIVTECLPPWLDGARDERPPFLFVHALDAHGPYLPEDPFHDTFFAHLGPERTQVPADSLNQTYAAVPHWMALTLQPDEKLPMPATLPNEELEARYDEALLKVDAFLGKLFDELRARNLYDDAVIVVTGDHGETFGPGVWGHGILREDVLHVPLLLKLPKNAHGGDRVTRPVSLVDVYPTLLTLAGVPPEPTRLHGTNLMERLGAPSTPDSNLYCEAGWIEQYTITSGRWRLVEERPGSESADYSLLTHPRVPAEWLREHFPEVLEQPLTEKLLDELRLRPGYAERIAELRKLVAGPYHSLYDLESDPDELHEASAQHPEIVARLLPLLAAERERSRRARAEARPGATAPSIDPAQRAELEALGYGGGPK